ncbi:peptidoglycan D,D-transpeptidase FtsI family protein [Endomicrobium proavitum]|uniref:Transpeptidase involved in septal peptidoglycan synthesis (Penicillin-binding protein 3) n=1 Tax=Endomicrobium proavitum TaxID=1408281 RepID=A0A0G3WJJ9_9BACT|nr:penicillin-binding protein 2 [Endomicrobium proavitum]AKL97674.1 transpeptidase involved in septal peptidoglycan synthesis (penicillin-binding protein 3) [Endomicrobium proavitum]
MINTKNRHDKRRKAIAAAVLFIFFALFIRLVSIQIFKSSEINYTVEKMVRRETLEAPRRGDILDARGRTLATSVKKYTLFIDPQSAKDYPEIKKVLLNYGIKIKQRAIEEFGDTAYFPVAFNIDDETMRKIRNEKLTGIGFNWKYVRQYPENRLLAHILGVTDSDGIGLEGIEKVCEGYLSGDKVITRQYRDGKGRIINDKIVDKEKIQGLDVTLTIDKNVQFIAEQELRKAFGGFKALKAACIVQNPKTGEILAMVSFPDFDISGKIKNVGELRNAAISDGFEPGSTFKIVAIAAALEESKITLAENFYLENGKYKIYKHTINDDHKLPGSATAVKIMEQSSNIGLVKIAQKLGTPLFYEYIRKFGFNSLSGIDLPGEARGLLSDKEKWDGLSLPSISFGQSLNVTALQLVNSYSVIANGGVLMKPILIKNIDKIDVKQDFEFAPKEVRRVISEETAANLRKILKSVVDNGTGKAAKAGGYTTAGKTGTAQKYDPSIKRYSSKNYIASFCGFVPAENPQITVLVVIDSPKGSDYYAASVAAPVFAKIAQRTAEYLNIPKDDLSVKNNDKRAK